jgi:hypothetical protein
MCIYILILPILCPARKLVTLQLVFHHPRRLKRLPDYAKATECHGSKGQDGVMEDVVGLTTAISFAAK